LTVPAKGLRPVPMLAECIDAVIGVDTHRDTHHAEIAHPSGAVIAACSIPSTSAGYAQLLAWASEHAPCRRLVISIEGTRSYGAGLARAATAAGLMVTECEQPTRKTRPLNDLTNIEASLAGVGSRPRGRSSAHTVRPQQIAAACPAGAGPQG
jgi:hypothetical protein